VELEAHIEMMQSVRAERLLDAAQVATYPLHLQHAPQHAKAWWQRLISDAQDVVIATVRQTAQRGARFSFNGLAVGVGELKTQLSEVLGGGLAA
jgi:hypothetical protein